MLSASNTLSRGPSEALFMMPLVIFREMEGSAAISWAKASVPASSSSAAHAGARKQNLLRPLGAHNGGQGGHDAHLRGQADLAEVGDDLGVLRRAHQVAGQHHAHRAAHGVAPHHGDHRLAGGADGPDGAQIPPQAFPAEFGGHGLGPGLVQVAAGTEVFPRAPQDDDPDFIIQLQVIEIVGNEVHHHRADGVFLFGLIEIYDAHSPVFFQINNVFFHARASLP